MSEPKDTAKKKSEIGKKANDELFARLSSIAKVSGVDLDAIAKNIKIRSPKEMRAEETRLASIEIAERNKRQREEFVTNTRKSGHIDPTWTFERLIVDDANGRAITDAKFFCEARLRNPQPPSVFILAGNPGSGKTVLVNAMANYWLCESNHDTSEHDVCIATASYFERSRVFNQSEDREDVKRRRESWERFCNASFLVIDGLCDNGQGLSTFMQKILGELLRTRFEKNLSMALTITLPSMKFFPQAVGPLIFEALRQYDSQTALLFGNSRRKPIYFNGIPLE